MNAHHFQFDWDKSKAAANLARHGISFELASTVFGDPSIFTVADAAHSETEERWFSIGLASTGAVLAVAYLWTEVSAGLIKVRLISARHATKTEIRYYTEGP